jgi:pyrroline-5-carboxylate reductase
MNKVGFIGYGHMGSILLNSLLLVKAINPQQVVISTRTIRKLDDLKVKYPAIEIASDNPTVARQSSILFLCVGTYQVKSVLDEIKGMLSREAHLVLMSGMLEMASVERVWTGAMTKIIPTLIAEVREGITLICHNQKVKPAEKDQLHQMLRKIGSIKVIQESQMGRGSDFTSCGPGLLAAIGEQFVQVGVKEGNFTYEEGYEMFLSTLYGTAKLLHQNKENFKGLINRVARKGGPTEGGATVLETHLPEVLAKMFSATLERRETGKQGTRQQFLMP